MAVPIPGSGNPNTTCVQKTIVIKPGDTVVLPRKYQIVQTILEDDAQASTLCENFLKNIRNESRNNYGFFIEFVSELSDEQTLDGISINGQDYPFGFSIPFKGTFEGRNGLNGEWAGDNIYEAIINAVPDGNVLFTKVSTQYNYYGGPSNDSSRDNMDILQLTVGSFPSVMGDDGSNVYLYGTDIPRPGSTTDWGFTNYKTRYYAIPKT